MARLDVTDFSQMTGDTKSMPKFLSLFVLLMALMTVSGCFPVLVAGGGAAVGAAAVSEGGVKGALSDLEIKALILDKWFSYDSKLFAKLSLTVDQGRVLVSGAVQNPDARVEAIRLVWQVQGVKQVINEVTVAESEGIRGFLRDKWITTRVRTAFTLDKDVQTLNYSIDTVQGTVFLMGVAQSQAELEKALGLARNIPYVKRVVSYINIKKSVREGEAASPSYDQTYDQNENFAPQPEDGSGQIGRVKPLQSIDSEPLTPAPDEF